MDLDNLDNRLTELWATLSNECHDQTETLRQVSREAKARHDRQLNEAEEQQLEIRRNIKLYSLKQLMQLLISTADVNRKNEKRARAAQAIKSCLDKIGIDFGTMEAENMEQVETGETLVKIQRLHPNCRQKTFILCFSDLGGDVAFRGKSSN
jgi:hypothetical protein